MHSHSIAPWTHDHAFLGEHHGQHERRTWSVVALTAAMMVAEIAGGTLFGSIALVADGWHMATHVAALAIAGLAYLFARRHADDTRFSLGTGKFGELAAFGSAIILGMIALGIGYESILRLLHPVTIHFQEAIPIAALGLCVNLLSAWLLHEGHEDDHEHDHGHADHDHRSPSPRRPSRHQSSRGLCPRAGRRDDFGSGHRRPVGRLAVRMDVHGSAGRTGRHGGDRKLGARANARRRQRAARHRSRRRTHATAFASGWKSAATGWPTCMCGNWVRAMPR